TSDCVIGVRRSHRPTAGFGNKHGIPLMAVLAGPKRKVVEVNVRSKKIQARTCSAINFHRMWQGAAAVVLSWLVVRPNQRRVSEHGKWILRLACCSHCIDVACVVPGHEEIVSDRLRSEDLLPSAFRFLTRRNPRFMQRR